MSQSKLAIESEMTTLYNDGDAIKAMELREVCELGKRMCVINSANEEIILEKSKEMEDSVANGKKANKNTIDQRKYSHTTSEGWVVVSKNRKSKS